MARRSWSGLLLAVGTAALLAAAPAHALTAPTNRALAPYGVSVRWDYAASGSVTPGQEVTVSVRRGRAAVALLRTTTTGRVLRHVAGRRDGHAHVFRIPAVAGAHYLLRLRAGGRTFGSRLVASLSPCPGPSGQVRWAVGVRPAKGPAGTRVTLSLRNAGMGCIAYGAAYDWQQRAADGTWVHVGPALFFPQWAAFAAPGSVFRQTLTVPALPPGPYRVEKEGATTPFTVTAG